MKSPSFKMMKRNETEEKGGERIDRAKQIAILLSDYQNLIFSLCYQMTQNYFEAEDLAQETFVQPMSIWTLLTASTKRRGYAALP